MGSKAGSLFRLVVELADLLFIKTAQFTKARRMVSLELATDLRPPKPLPVNIRDRIIIVAPHQDDETIGCGGLIIWAKRNNIPIEVILLTDGLQQEADMSAYDIVKIRNLEMSNAAKRLGVRKIHKIGVNNVDLRFTRFHDVLLEEIITKFVPTKIFIPHKFDRPIKHIKCHQWLTTRKVFRVENIALYGYQVHSPLIAKYYIELDEIDMQAKLAAIREYKSQLKYVPYDHYSLGLASWNARLVKGAKYVELYSHIN